MTFLTKSRYKETFCSPSPSQMKKGGGGKNHTTPIKVIYTGVLSSGTRRIPPWDVCPVNHSLDG